MNKSIVTVLSLALFMTPLLHKKKKVDMNRLDPKQRNMKAQQNKQHQNKKSSKG